MIEVKDISKSFDDIPALDGVSATISDGEVFGLIGTNGAGKSTFLRILCGVLRADRGEVLADDMPVYENPAAKQNIFYISDEQHFFANSTPEQMIEFYATVYKKFDRELALQLFEKFGLDKGRKINTFSKGMKKQVSVIMGVSAGTKYLLCDETFDGLDPVMRQAVKSLFAAQMEDRGLTPIVASHNLRELEDICDHVGLLHKGGILFSKDLDELKFGTHKIQIVFKDDDGAAAFTEGMDVVRHDSHGSLHTLLIKGSRAGIEEAAKAKAPVFFEVLPLSLEEIFIAETEVVGYDIKSLIL